MSDAVHRTRSRIRLVGAVAGRLTALHHVPGVATATAGVVGLALLWLAPLGGWITGVTLTTDATPLVVAEGPSAPVVGYVGTGTTRAYIPVTAVVAVLAGELVAASGRSVGYLAAALLGVAGASGVVVLSACGCGTGSTAYLYDVVAGTL